MRCGVVEEDGTGIQQEVELEYTPVIEPGAKVRKGKLFWDTEPEGG